MQAHAQGQGHMQPRAETAILPNILVTAPIGPQDLQFETRVLPALDPPTLSASSPEGSELTDPTEPVVLRVPPTGLAEAYAAQAEKGQENPPRREEQTAQAHQQHLQRMAPAHVYNPSTGTGIAWHPDRVELWEGGRVTESAQHSTGSPWEFWYGLHFREAFPFITHWWFGSAWTGKVWLRAIDADSDGRVITGGIRFVDREEPEQLWQIVLSAPVRVSTPLPPFQVNPVNLPLRVVLAEYCLGLRNGDVGACLSPQAEDDIVSALAEDGELDLEEGGALGRAACKTLDTASPYHLITSLVAREQLEAAFPTVVGAWHLEGVDVPLRVALCSLMGLEAPTLQWTLR